MSTLKWSDKQEWIAVYSCSILILQGQNEYFKEL